MRDKSGVVAASDAISLGFPCEGNYPKFVSLDADGAVNSAGEARVVQGRDNYRIRSRIPRPLGLCGSRY